MFMMFIVFSFLIVGLALFVCAVTFDNVLNPWVSVVGAVLVAVAMFVIAPIGSMIDPEYKTIDRTVLTVVNQIDSVLELNNGKTIDLEKIPIHEYNSSIDNGNIAIEVRRRTNRWSFAPMNRTVYVIGSLKNN